MKKLFNVTLEYEMVIVAEDEEEALYGAKQNIENEYAPFENVSLISCKSEIPEDWMNYEPLGFSEDPKMSGTCRDIFDNIEKAKKEEEDRKKAVLSLWRER